MLTTCATKVEVTGGKLAGFGSDAIELFALCYHLCLFWLVCWPPTTNNTQTKYMQLARRLWVQVQLQPTFFNSVFNLGIANGAKVGLNLRLQALLGKKLIMKWNNDQ